YSGPAWAQKLRDDSDLGYSGGRPTNGSFKPSDIRVRLHVSKRRYLVPSVLAVLVVAAAGLSLRARAPEPKAAAGNATVAIARRDFVRSVRLNGTVEAVESTGIQAPRLAGQNSNSLVIMRLVPNGSTVKPGDMLVEFDRQEQLRNALD